MSKRRKRKRKQTNLSTTKLRRSPALCRKRVLVGYAERDLHLHKLGFVDYKSYLKSDLWADIRQHVLERDSYKCFICSGGANQVHHIQYSLEALGGTNLKRLISVCVPCHKSIEFYGSEKLDLDETQAVVRIANSIRRRYNLEHQTALDHAKIAIMCGSEKDRQLINICKGLGDLHCALHSLHDGVKDTSKLKQIRRHIHSVSARVRSLIKNVKIYGPCKSSGFQKKRIKKSLNNELHSIKGRLDHILKCKAASLSCGV